MRRFWILFCGWLLPLIALADVAEGIELRLVAGEYMPGDVIEIQAEMRRADFAEFRLHVPTHPQLHFVAHTLEPLHYAEGVYVQRSVLLLQPMVAGAFELDAITASVSQGAALTEVELPVVKFTVKSYGAVNDSKALQPLQLNALLPPQASDFVGLIVLLVAVLLFVIYFIKSRAKLGIPPVMNSGETLADLSATIQRGDSPVALIERLLTDDALMLSVDLREALQAAVYANRLDAERLLCLIREEPAR